MADMICNCLHLWFHGSAPKYWDWLLTKPTMPTADYSGIKSMRVKPGRFQSSICLWKRVWSFLPIHNHQKHAKQYLDTALFEKAKDELSTRPPVWREVVPTHLCQTWGYAPGVLPSLGDSSLWSCCAVSPRQRSWAAQIWCSLEVSKDHVETVQKGGGIDVHSSPQFHGTNWRD